MAPHPGPVLVDTNVIIECHRSSSWRALAGGYRLETTKDCVGETQAGRQNRRAPQEIDETGLRRSLHAVHNVSTLEFAKLALRGHGLALDRGEESLWAHALARGDTWLLCGPDRASLRCGVLIDYRDRLVSLERLLDDIGHRSRFRLKDAYTEKWRRRTMNELVLAI